MATTTDQQVAEAPGTWSGFAVTLAATATILMLEATRVFVAYLVFVVDQSRRIELGAIALGVFAAIGLGGLLPRLAGWRLIVCTTALVLAAARLALQFWQSPEARIVFGALVIVCWGWLMTRLFETLRDAAALGVLLGMSLDLAIRIGFETVDLPWMPDRPAHLVTGVLVALLVIAALIVIGPDAPPHTTAPAHSLVALGPGLAVYHLLTGNLGIAQTLLGIDFPEAAAILAVGTIVGLLLSGLAAATPAAAGTRDWLRSPRIEGPLAIVILAVIGALGVWFFWQSPGMSELALVLGVAGSYVLLALALLGSEPGRRRAGNVSAWLTLGMLLQAGLLFTYYTFTGPTYLIVAAWGLLLVGTFLNGTRASIAPAWQPPSLRVWFGVAAVALLAVSVQQALIWSQPTSMREPLASKVVVMTYNIQAGFSRENDFDLEQTARTIEMNDPDIVILQEVSRGWLVLTGIDEVLWLSQRLKMPFYFGAASDDGLWGNAILTRAKVTDEMVREFTSSENFTRSAVGVSVETKSRPLWVFATHLDNPDDATEVRLEQVEQLLAFWDGRTPAVIAGDFNATPDSDVVQHMRGAGFSDSSALIGDATTSEDKRRIDYIFTSPGIEVTEVRIDETWTSDHLPVTTWMTVLE